MPQSAPPAPSAPAEKQKPKGAVGIWIGVLLIIGGIVLGIILVVSGARSLLSGFDDLERVPINGGGVVRIADSGTQTIYAERPSSGSGTSFSTGTFNSFGPNVSVRVIGPGGEDITVNSSAARETYTYDGREGVSIGTFYASAPGTYRVVSQLQDGSSWNMIAVGSALELSGVGAILGGVFGGGLIVLIGIIVVIVFAVRRSRSKKRLIQATTPYPSAYGAPGAGWPAAPGYAAPGGYGAPQAPGGYGAPPAPGGWPAADNPGWAPPPVVQPGAPNAGPADPGPAWTPPASPPPPAPTSPSDASWQPPAPAEPSSWPPAGAAPPAPPAGDPPAPSWDPPAPGDAPPPPPPPPTPPPGGDGPAS